MIEGGLAVITNADALTTCVEARGAPPRNDRNGFPERGAGSVAGNRSTWDTLVVRIRFSSSDRHRDRVLTLARSLLAAGHEGTLDRLADHTDLDDRGGAPRRLRTPDQVAASPFESAAPGSRAATASSRFHAPTT